MQTIIVGRLADVAYVSDSLVFSADGISPTIRAEAHGHLPNILVYADRELAGAEEGV